MSTSPSDGPHHSAPHRYPLLPLVWIILTLFLHHFPCYLPALKCRRADDADRTKCYSTYDGSASDRVWQFRFAECSQSSLRALFRYCLLYVAVVSFPPCQNVVEFNWAQCWNLALRGSRKWKRMGRGGGAAREAALCAAIASRTGASGGAACGSVHSGAQTGALANGLISFTYVLTFFYLIFVTISTVESTP